MKILIAGPSGLVGKELVPFLKKEGHQVNKLVRQKDSVAPDEIFWDPEKKICDVKQFEGFDAFINLSGENIAAHRWTEKRKREILESRLESTGFLAEIINQLKEPPKTLINSSAIGIYGNRGDEKLYEKSTPGNGFLANVCKQWEKATDKINSKTIRVVHLRTGMVVTTKGGALAEMLTPFKLGLGGVLGSGNQYMSWVSLEDLKGIIQFILITTELNGDINAVSPHPVTNYDWTKCVGKALNRPTILPFPAFAARLVFGEIADELLLSSMRVYPQKLLNANYVFRFPYLDGCLKYYLS